MSSINLRIAYNLACASKAVYLKPEETEGWAKDRGYTDFKWIESFDTQCAIFETDEQIIVVFRGTTNIQDWLTNLDVWQEPFIYGQVHSGFLEALDAVWNDVENAVQDSRDLYIAGHSLGGALATLAAARFGAAADGLYTFGSPRTGDPEFTRQFNKIHRSYRFVNNNDVVPRIPIRNYSHIDSLRHFTHKGTMWTDPHWGWVEWDRLMGRVRRQVADGIRDHSIDAYVSLVARQI